MTTQPETARKRTADVVSAEVRAWTARLGLRQKHLSEILKISQPQVSARLNGHLPWNTDEIDALADAFGIEPGDLMRTPPQGISAAAILARLPRVDSNHQPAGSLPAGYGSPAANRAA